MEKRTYMWLTLAKLNTTNIPIKTNLLRLSCFHLLKPRSSGDKMGFKLRTVSRRAVLG